MLNALLCIKGIFLACIWPESSIPIDAKKVASSIHKKPFTISESSDQSALLISLENIMDSPVIPISAPKSIGNLTGFLKKINPLRTVNKVSVEKIRHTTPVVK